MDADKYFELQEKAISVPSSSAFFKTGEDGSYPQASQICS